MGRTGCACGLKFARHFSYFSLYKGNHHDARPPLAPPLRMADTPDARTARAQFDVRRAAYRRHVRLRTAFQALFILPLLGYFYGSPGAFSDVVVVYNVPPAAPPAVSAPPSAPGGGQDSKYDFGQDEPEDVEQTTIGTQVVIFYWDRIFAFCIYCILVALPWDECVGRRRQYRRARDAAAADGAARSGERFRVSCAPVSESQVAVTGSCLCVRASEDVVLRSLSLGGDLGSLHVFASRVSTPAAPPATWVEWLRASFFGSRHDAVAYCQRTDYDWREWVASYRGAALSPSWGATTTLILSPPVPIKAGESRYVYIRCTPTE